MSCVIYLQKFSIGSIPRGGKKAFETRCGRAVLAAALSDIYNIDLDELTFSFNKYGKPYFEGRSDIHFNISHSGGYAAAAVCDHPVGVDVQVVRSVSPRLAEKVCDACERKYIERSAEPNRAFIRLWALKESYVKAIGMGMAFPMNEISFRLGSSDTVTGRISNKEGLFTLRDYGDYVLAACVLI